MTRLVATSSATLWGQSDLDVLGLRFGDRHGWPSTDKLCEEADQTLWADQNDSIRLQPYARGL